MSSSDGRPPTTTLWRKAAEAIQAQVLRLPVGSKLPSEAEQGAILGASRVTIRRALLSLQDDGFITSHPGQGWFTSNPDKRSTERFKPASEPIGRLLSFTEMARQAGASPDSIELDKYCRAATEAECAHFDLTAGSQILILKRLRRFDRQPVAIDNSKIPLAVLPDAMDIDFGSASLHACFRLAGAVPTYVDVEITASVSQGEQSRLLKVQPHSPLTHLRQAFFDGSGRPIELGNIFYRHDTYRFRARLGA